MSPEKLLWFTKGPKKKPEPVKCPRLFRATLKDWYGIEITSEEFRKMQEKVTRRETTFIRYVPVVKKFNNQPSRQEHALTWTFSATNQECVLIVVVDSASQKIVSARKPLLRK